MRSTGPEPRCLEAGDAMNRALFIVMIPALLVAAGYIVVLRIMGIAPGYPRLLVAALFFGMIYWLAHRRGRKVKSSRA